MLTGTMQRCPYCGYQGKPARESVWLIGVAAAAWVAVAGLLALLPAARRCTRGLGVACAAAPVPRLQGALDGMNSCAAGTPALPKFGKQHR